MIITSIQQEIRYHKPAMALDRLFPREGRQKATSFLFLIFILLGFVWAGSSFLFTLIPDSISVPEDGIVASFLLVGSVWFFIFALNSFFNTRYLRGSTAFLSDDPESYAKSGITYEVALILSQNKDDVLAGFINSDYGHEMIQRLNLDREAVKKFLTTKRHKISASSIQLPKKGFLSFDELALYLLEEDKQFSDFLFSQGIQKNTYIGTATFIDRLIEEQKWQTRWWGRGKLESLQPIGRGWAYGSAYMLERFAREPRSSSVFSGIAAAAAQKSFLAPDLNKLTTTLSRAKEANAILIGDDGVGKRDIIVALKNNIQNEDVSRELLQKRVLVLDDEAFIAQNNTKALFERNMIKMLKEADKAGNIILTILDFPGFIKSAEALGSDIGSLLDPYFNSPDLHIIATSNPASYHSVIEARPSLLQRFEKIFIEAPGSEGVIAVLESVVSSYEKQYNVLFTYQALETIATNADRYIPGGVMPDKAVDLLVEVLPAAGERGVSIITSEFINTYVKDKTGIPVGAVSEDEREILLNLEKVLHERVIGQNEAIDTIANAMRRARAGIQSPDRPMGSFLFLGPTGVGKTETAKALTEVFFKSEHKLLRLDMSEYNGIDALHRLIGTGRESAGDLSKILKQNPYGVLLLDEFEKSSSDVQDLFLQILDEGVFTNSRGEKINARNTIIIATSNAGSSLIWEYGEGGAPLADKKDEIIDKIIEAGTYKPELINRFDGVILFHALSKEHLREIAKIMLERLKERIREKGYNLVINDVLVNLLVEEGYDPQFGARPMRRVVQDRIEKVIARKIIEGSLKRGATIKLSELDFQ